MTPMPAEPADAADSQPAPVEPAEAFALAGEELEALTAKAEKADEYLQLAQRTQADFENFRKRAAREAAIAKERGATKLALELLPAVDNLERALEHAPPSENDDDGALRVRHQARALRRGGRAAAGRHRAILARGRAVRSDAARGGRPAAGGGL